jgi:hypothetical protein
MGNPIILNQESAIRAGAERRNVRGAQSEHIVHLDAHYVFPNYLRLGVSVAENHTQAANAQHPDGEVRRFDGKVRRGEIYFQHDFEGGSMLRGGLLLRESSIGARPGATAGYDFVDAGGRLRLQADYGRPLWEFLEGIVGGGVRDRAEARREQRFGDRFSGRIAVGANRYGLERGRNVAASLTADGGLTVLFGRNGRVGGIDYAFDSEFSRAFRIETRASDGQAFRPIPLVNREVHAMSLFADVQLHRFQTNAFGGYAIDRVGGRGPFFGATATLRPGRSLDIQGFIDRRLNSSVTTQVATRYGGQLIWRFD